MIKENTLCNSREKKRAGNGERGDHTKTHPQDKGVNPLSLVLIKNYFTIYGCSNIRLLGNQAAIHTLFEIFFCTKIMQNLKKFLQLKTPFVFSKIVIILIQKTSQERLDGNKNFSPIYYVNDDKYFRSDQPFNSLSNLWTKKTTSKCFVS